MYIHRYIRLQTKGNYISIIYRWMDGENGEKILFSTFFAGLNIVSCLIENRYVDDGIKTVTKWCNGRKETKLIK